MLKIIIEGIIEYIKLQLAKIGRSYKEGHASREDIHPIQLHGQTKEQLHIEILLTSTNKVFLTTFILCRPWKGC